MADLSILLEAAPRITKTLASLGGGASAGFLVATAIKIFFPDLPILKDPSAFYSLLIALGIALERFVNFFLFVLLPRGAQLLLLELPRFLEARKCWDTLAPTEKQALLDSLFYTLLYRPVPKTSPPAARRLGRGGRPPAKQRNVRDPVAEQAEVT